MINKSIERWFILFLSVCFLVHGNLFAQEQEDNPTASTTEGASGEGGQQQGKKKKKQADQAEQDYPPIYNQREAPGGRISMPEVTVQTTTPPSSAETFGAPNAAVLPTEQGPISSTYGIPMSVMDTPRQVTPVNQTMMKASGVVYQGYLDPLSVSQLLPTAYTELNWGMGNAVTIRGRQALPYFNGIEMTLQNDSMAGVPFSWNMIESMDITEGPANAVFGATQPTPGSVNYITKQPYFDKFRGYIWDTTGMYNQYLWGADVGGPVNDKVAWRFSYMGQEQGSYYNNIYNNQQNFYVAIGAKPYENYTVDFYGDFGTYSFMPQLADQINRPTNALIDNGLYTAGMLPPGALAGTLISPFFVPVNRRADIVNPEGGGEAMTGMLQLIQHVKVSDNIEVVNNTFFWYTRSAWIEPSLYVAAYLSGDYEVDNRTEVRVNFETPLEQTAPEKGQKEMKEYKETAKSEGDEEVKKSFWEGAIGEMLMRHNIDTGIEWHYQRNLDYFGDAFWNAGNVWSMMTTNPLTWNATMLIPFVKAIDNPKGPAGGEWQIPGAPPGWFYEPLNGASGSTDCNYWTVNPFYQHNIDWTSKFSLLFGARANFYFVDASTPPGPVGAPFAHFSTAALAPLVNISPVYKPFPWMTAYFDYNWLQTTNAAVIGGYAPTFQPNSFSEVNQLIEGGLKFNILKDKMYITTAAFTQNQILNNLGFLPNGAPLPATPTTVEGFEINASYQPDRHFWARLGYIYMRAVEEWSSFPPGLHGPSMRQLTPILPYYTGVPIAGGPFINLPFPISGTMPSSNYAFIGFPDQYFSGTVTYTSDVGLGITLGAIVMSDQYLNYWYNTKIPTQFILNAQIFYSQPKWEARLYLYNFTDEKYWLPFGLGSAGSRAFNMSSIIAGWPFWIEGTVAWKF
ncbi:TonB-dependent receptor [Candidatus Methylacidiphilum infernorum]|nr:TonB-dependent receptor [Candidatus Methylacidiphilum infernorum]